MSAAALIRAGEPAGPRHVLTTDAWRALAATADPALRFVALWADTQEVHALFLEGPTPLLASVAVTDGGYPALSTFWPEASRPERAVRDLFGHNAAGATDLRPLLDHGAWEHARPRSPRPTPSPGGMEAPEFAGPEDAGQIALGPVGGILAPPSHLRAFVRSGKIETLSMHTGYAHRGAMRLMQGRSPRAAAGFVARLDGRATVAHATAFARAAEAASGVAPPPRVASLRHGLLALETLACHLADAAPIVEGDPAPRRADSAAIHLERLREALAATWGHRLAMDVVVPGGLALAPKPEGLQRVTRMLDLAEADRRLPASLKAPVAAAREPPLDPIDGPLTVDLPPVSAEGLGAAEAAFGTVWHWLRIDAGRVAACHAASPDPAALQALAVGHPPADLPAMERALGYSVPGFDL